uniref:Ribophorin 2 family protein n=1 Tax=Rhizophora mucronata TaxID=61149 RepID=A0A2P2LYJ3_RHIMU
MSLLVSDSTVAGSDRISGMETLHQKSKFTFTIGKWITGLLTGFISQTAVEHSNNSSYKKGPRRLAFCIFRFEIKATK